MSTCHPRSARACDVAINKFGGRPYDLEGSTLLFPSDGQKFGKVRCSTSRSRERMAMLTAH